ncbi:MAG: IS1 family transposase [Deltaproteobacteria bacterium]|nr:IS1 family transposase [Myxococcales bacterium]MDP3213952.1 IS1 family transposase [Deltaproteobacteria bacterium]
MSNNLPESKQIAVLSALVEGVSIRATSRMTDVSQPTILSLLVRMGEGCAALHDSIMRGLACERLECDEIWSFVQKKQRHVREDEDPRTVGDSWTFVAIDADTKLVPSYLVGKRTAADTSKFIADLKGRLTNRVQISTDGLSLYINAIDDAFGCDVDYAMIVKSYESEPAGPGRYSPPKVTSTEKTIIMGSPDEDLISTSYVERDNLTMRMQMRRFTRLTNGFSKKPRNHAAAVALHFAHYNLCRIHQTLRTTPAMAAGVSDHVWSMEELLNAALHGERQ